MWRIRHSEEVEKDRDIERSERERERERERETEREGERGIKRKERVRLGGWGGWGGETQRGRGQCRRTEPEALKF